MEDILNQSKLYVEKAPFEKRKLLDIALCSCFWGVVYATLGEKNKEQKKLKKRIVRDLGCCE